MKTNVITKQADDSPGLDEFQLLRLSQAIQGLSSPQLSWASGYLAAISQTQPAHSPVAAIRVTILYASHTGNGRTIAEQLADDASARGLGSRVLSIADFKPRDLAKEQIVILVISTHGEGEVPESAAEFHRFLFSTRAPQLSQLHFSIFALGDSSYAYFCQAGKDIDARLQELGAKRLLARVDADVSFQQQATDWGRAVIQQTSELIPSAASNVVNLSARHNTVRINRDHPYAATVLENRRLTTDDAIADVRHIVLQIDPQVLPYQPGDALGVWHKNDPALVQEIIRAAGLDSEQTVTIDGTSLSLTVALRDRLELTLLHPSVVKNWASISAVEALLDLATETESLRAYAQQRQLIDLLSEYPAQPTAQALVDSLQPLQPRLYSIASSQQLRPDEVHLTVSALHYSAHGRAHQGSASGHLVDRLEENDVIGVYLAENKQFRLPENKATPIIMIGAGTGIAPYRAFLQQRQADAASGKNWLIFGNRHFRRDFLYQQDWINLRKAGFLNRVSLAFSRDTTTRAYIQDRLREDGEELYQWLQQGAQLYVCGSIAIEQAVRESIGEIAALYGPADADHAETFIDKLRAQGRYLRDVY